jgi:hypothetical protein
MKASVISIAILALGLGGSVAQASVPSNVQGMGAQDRAVASATEPAKSDASKKANGGQRDGGVQVAWCYWYRTGNLLPCR